MGQYRDKSSHLAMVEYRQMFNTDCSNWFKKIVNHLGYVAWTGCGFMGPNPGRIEGVLPNFGVGLRIEVQPRMNIRLDLCRTLLSCFHFSVNLCAHRPRTDRAGSSPLPDSPCLRHAHGVRATSASPQRHRLARPSVSDGN